MNGLHPGHKWSHRYSHLSHLGLGPSTAGPSTAVWLQTKGHFLPVGPSYRNTQPGVAADTGPLSIPKCKSGFFIESRPHISKPPKVWTRIGAFISKHSEVLGFTRSPLDIKDGAGHKAWRLVFLSGVPCYAITLCQSSPRGYHRFSFHT